MATKYQYLLIVDDQVGIRKMLFELFTSEGLNVELAANGKEALAKVRAKTPALIMLDLKMPEMGGLQTIAELNKIAPHVPVILITAYIENFSLDKTLDHDLHKYYVLVKPFDLEYLRQLVNRILNIPKKVTRRQVI